MTRRKTVGRECRPQASQAELVLLLFAVIVCGCTESFLVPVEAEYARMTLDPWDRPCIVYQSFGENGSEVHYAVWDGPGLCGAWSDEYVDLGRIFSLAVDSTNQPHLVYYTTEGQIKYATRVVGAWVPEVIDTPIAYPPAVCIGVKPDRVPAMAFVEETIPYLEYRIVYGERNEAAWAWETALTISDPTGLTIRSLRFVLGPGGTPHIACRYITDVDPHSVIHNVYVTRQEGVWTAEFVGGASPYWLGAPYGIDLAVDSQGRPALSVDKCTASSGGPCTESVNIWRKNGAAEFDLVHSVTGSLSALQPDSHDNLRLAYKTGPLVVYASETPIGWLEWEIFTRYWFPVDLHIASRDRFVLLCTMGAWLVTRQTL